MTEIIIALIEQLNSSVFVLILILVLFCYCLFMFAKWLGKYEEKASDTTITLNKIEARIDILPELKRKIELIYNNTLANNKSIAESRKITKTKRAKKIKTKIGTE